MTPSKPTRTAAHAAVAFVLVDPSQADEDTTVIHGVFGSLGAAQHGERAARTRGDILENRVSRIERWVGTTRTAAWERTPVMRGRAFVWELGEWRAAR